MKNVDPVLQKCPVIVSDDFFLVKADILGF